VFPSKNVPFKHRFEIPMGANLLTNLHFDDVNRCFFQAKPAKYSKFRIIKTTASIPAKFCTTIKTIKYPSWWSQGASNKSKMADSCHLEKMINRYLIDPMKLSTMMQNNMPDRIDC